VKTEMRERADEARGTSDEAMEPLVAESATLWAKDADDAVAPPGDTAALSAAVGDLGGFLGAYYRRVAPEVLVTAGPLRMAAVAARHAALGASRPQGRAAVQVRDSG
jgi:hypothetical protein